MLAAKPFVDTLYQQAHNSLTWLGLPMTELDVHRKCKCQQ